MGRLPRELQPTQRSDRSKEPTSSRPPSEPSRSLLISSEKPPDQPPAIHSSPRRVESLSLPRPPWTVARVVREPVTRALGFAVDGASGEAEVIATGAAPAGSPAAAGAISATGAGSEVS